MKYLSKAPVQVFRGKNVLLRVDFNIEDINNKDSLFRIDSSIPTIKRLLKSGARVILMSHRGRPLLNKKGLSLRSLVPLLARRTGASVDFVSVNKIAELKSAVDRSRARLVLLENLRFFGGEEKNDYNFAKILSGLGDIYINDAFAVSHRKNASVVAITNFLPSYVGLLLEKEITNLDKVKKIEKRPFLLIIAGAKTADKIGVIDYFSEKADWIILGGGPANTFFKASGLPIYKSVHDPKLVSIARRFLKNKNIVLPVDLREKDGKILDIGPYTEREFIKIIKKSKMILWNGPMGKIEKKSFGIGTKKIAFAISKSKSFSVVGGGETVAFLNRLGLIKKFNFVSTGGGAMLAYLAGEKLPGIRALK